MLEERQWNSQEQIFFTGLLKPYIYCLLIDLPQYLSFRVMDFAVNFLVVNNLIFEHFKVYKI